MGEGARVCLPGVPCVSRLPPLVVPDRERFTILCARRRPPALIDKRSRIPRGRPTDSVNASKLRLTELNNQHPLQRPRASAQAATVSGTRRKLVGRSGCKVSQLVLFGGSRSRIHAVR